MENKPWMIYLATLIVVVVVVYGGIEYTSKPAFCARCHEITPNYLSWQKSPHKDVNCLKCHVDPGPAALVKRKFAALGEIYYHFTGNYKIPLQARVNTANCLNCHTGKDKKFSYNKNITLTSGPKAPAFSHADVLRNNVSCLQCHADVAHGNVAQGK